MVLKTTLQKQSSRKSLLKVNLKKITVQKPIVKLRIVIFNQMIKYQFLHMLFNQIIDHKHNINFNRKLSTKLLVHTANENTKFMFAKAGQLLLLMYGFRSNYPEKFQGNTTSLGWKVNIQKLDIRFWVVTSRSSHQGCSTKKVALKNFTILTEKHLPWSLFLIKSLFYEKSFQHRCFPVNITKFIKPI